MTGTHGPADIADAELGQRVCSKQTNFNNGPQAMCFLPLIWYTFHNNRSQTQCEDYSMQYEREVVGLKTGVVVLELLQGFHYFVYA